MIIKNESDIEKVFSTNENVEIDEEFLKTLEYKLTIKAYLKSDGNELKGSATTDILNLCNDFQNSIYKIYAHYVKNKDDARSLTDEEKQELACIFKIGEGTVWDRLENMSSIIESFKNNKVALVALVVMVSGIVGWKYLDYKQEEGKNNTQKEMQNNTYEFARKVASEAQKNIILASANPKLKLEYLQFNNDEKKKIYGDEVYRRAGEIKENKKDTITNKIESYFYIKSLHNRGRNGKQKIAILENETMKIEVKIVEDFFEKNKQELYKYFDDYTKIKCEVIVEKDEDGNIVNGILNNIVK